MQKFRNHVWLIAGFLTVIVLLSGISAGPAIAQAVSALLVRDADNPARQAVHFQLADGLSFQVPAGKRLVVEYATALVVAASGLSMMQAELEATMSRTTPFGPSNSTVRHHLVLTPQGNDRAGRNMFTASQAVKIYADPGTNVSLVISRYAGEVRAFEGSIDGYLIDLNP